MPRSESWLPIEGRKESECKEWIDGVSGKYSIVGEAVVLEEEEEADGEDDDDDSSGEGSGMMLGEEATVS